MEGLLFELNLIRLALQGIMAGVLFHLMIYLIVLLVKAVWFIAGESTRHG